MVARGKETPGAAGTASTAVPARLSESHEGTSARRDLTVPGKPAQFGWDVMADVGATI